MRKLQYFARYFLRLLFVEENYNVPEFPTIVRNRTSTSWDEVPPNNRNLNVKRQHRLGLCLIFGVSHVGKSHKSCVLRDATVAMKLPCWAQVRNTIFATYDIRQLRYSPFTILGKKTNLEGEYIVEFALTVPQFTRHSYLQTTSNIIFCTISYLLRPQLNMCQLNFHCFSLYIVAVFVLSPALHLCQSILCWNCKPNTNLWKYEANFSNNNSNNKAL